MDSLTERLRGTYMEDQADLREEAADRIDGLKGALENIERRSKNSTETFFIWKVTQDVLHG